MLNVLSCQNAAGRQKAWRILVQQIHVGKTCVSAAQTNVKTQNSLQTCHVPIRGVSSSTIRFAKHRKTSKEGNTTKDTNPANMINGDYTQGRGEYKYFVDEDGQSRLEEPEDDEAAYRQAVTQATSALGGSDIDQMGSDDQMEDTSRYAFDDALDDELGGVGFDYVPPEDVGKAKRRISDVGSNAFHEKLMSDKMYMRQAGMQGISDDEAWPMENKHVRSMPMWMLWHYARSELESEVEHTDAEQKTELPTALIRSPMRDEKGRAYATGRRKTAVARVWVKAGDGKFTVNGMPLAYYFPSLEDRKRCLFPLIILEACGGFDVMCTTHGGGVSGQAGAVAHGLARALSKYDPYLKPAMKQYKLLKRDPRMVERKKPGQKKARKKFTWVKR